MTESLCVTKTKAHSFSPSLHPSFQNGAATRSRTLDLLITSELLYQLSYGGQNGCGILKNEIGQRNHPRPVYLCFPEIRWAQRHFSAGDAANDAVLLKKQGPVVINTPDYPLLDCAPC